MLLNVNEFFCFFLKTMSDTGTLYILDTPGSHSTCRKTNRIPYTSQVGLEEIWWGMFCFLLLERDLIIFYKTGLTMYFLIFFALYLIYLHCKSRLLVRYILNLVGDLDTLGHLTTYPCMSGWGKALHFSQRNTYQCVTIISIFRLQKENVT